MANPGAWGLTLAAGELAIGLLVLASERTARLGFFAAVAFHVALLMFLIRERGASIESPGVE